MQTKKQMGTHAKISYCVTITKTDENIYQPRLVFLFAEPVILECEDLLLIYGEFKTNPYAAMVDFSTAFIDGILQNESENRA